MTFKYEIPNSNILSHYADTAGPDSSDSPGALFLQYVADVTVDALKWMIEQDEIEPRRALEALVDDEEANEIADQSVPVYTHERWQVFVDLAAYQEDVTDLYGGDLSDLTQAAGVALYMIAERVVHAVAEDYVESLESCYLEDDGEPDEDPNPDPDGSLANQEADRYEKGIERMQP